MYGKVFDSIYDGTLYGHWEAIVTMQQLIVLCTPDGIVDMTPQAIAARTSIPLKIIIKGLEVLEQPDPHSRTAGDDGRRIVLMDDHRPWGWVLVNHSKYQHMQDADTVRAQTRERVRKHREARHVTDGNAPVTTVTDGNAEKRHSDSDSDTKKNSTGGSTARHEYSPEFETAFSALPKRDGSNPKWDAFKAWKKRIRDGVTPEVMIAGAVRYRDWCKATGKIGTEHVLQAKTFFGPGGRFEESFQAAPDTVKPHAETKCIYITPDTTDRCMLDVTVSVGKIMVDGAEVQVGLCSEHHKPAVPGLDRFSLVVHPEVAGAIARFKRFCRDNNMAVIS